MSVTGTDTTTRHLTSLLASARQLGTQGISAFIHTGGFPIPPTTVTGSVTDDLVIVDLVVGLGEVAIADFRSSEPSTHVLAEGDGFDLNRKRPASVDEMKCATPKLEKALR